MSLELKNAALYIEGAAMRAERGGFSHQASWLRKQAKQIRDRALMI